MSPPAIVAAKQATTTIPVVMAFWGDEGLIESGVVASFARPGGNGTGVYMLAAELDAKRFELLLKALPQARTVGVLNPGRGWSLTHLQHVAEARRIALRPSDVPGPEGYDTTFAAMSQAQVDAVLVPSFPRFCGITHEELIYGPRISAFSNHWPSCARRGATDSDQP